MCATSQSGSSNSSISSCSSNHKRRDAIIEIPAEALKTTRRQRIRSGWNDLIRVLTWQQAFQIIVATCTFVAGAGVGQEILHDPLATAEGVLNFPVIVSQVAVILSNIWRLHNPHSPRIPHLLALIEHLTIFASAFALLSHIFLSLLFSLPHFPNSVEIISSYGYATLLHFLLILTHGLQAAVLKWDDITAYLSRQLRRICDQIYTWHPDSKMENALQLPERRRGGSDPEKGAHDHHGHQHEEKAEGAESQQVMGCCHGGGTGLSAILADIIAHAVSLPTFFTAWVLQLRGVHVNDLAVAWTVDLSTLILLACIMHGSTKAGVKAWKKIAASGYCGEDVKPGVDFVKS